MNPSNDAVETRLAEIRTFLDSLTDFIHRSRFARLTEELP